MYTRRKKNLFLSTMRQQLHQQMFDSTTMRILRMHCETVTTITIYASRMCNENHQMHVSRTPPRHAAQYKSTGGGKITYNTYNTQHLQANSTYNYAIVNDKYFGAYKHGLRSNTIIRYIACRVQKNIRIINRTNLSYIVGRIRKYFQFQRKCKLILSD